MSIKSYRITLVQQWRMIFPLLLRYIIVCMAFLWIIGSETYLWIIGAEIDPMLLFIILFIFVFDILPAIFLHIQYYRANRHCLLQLDVRNRTATFSNKVTSISFDFKDISQLIKTRTLNSNIGWYSFDWYLYYTLKLVNGQQIIITCLMIQDIELNLEQNLPIKATLRRRLLPVVTNTKNRITNSDLNGS
jgi:hypothetical protein